MYLQFRKGKKIKLNIYYAICYITPWFSWHDRINVCDKSKCCLWALKTSVIPTSLFLLTKITSIILTEHLFFLIDFSCFDRYLFLYMICCLICYLFADFLCENKWNIFLKIFTIFDNLFFYFANVMWNSIVWKYEHFGKINFKYINCFYFSDTEINTIIIFS